jgi:hypothetical protein
MFRMGHGPPGKNKIVQDYTCDILDIIIQFPASNSIL